MQHFRFFVICAIVISALAIAGVSLSQTPDEAAEVPEVVPEVVTEVVTDEKVDEKVDNVVVDEKVDEMLELAKALHVKACLKRGEERPACEKAATDLSN